METILWTQTPGAANEDILLHNGIPCGGSDRQIWFERILTHHSTKRFKNQWAEKFRIEETAESGSRSHVLGYRNIQNKWLVEANYLEKDERGRRLVYRFYSDADDVHEFCRQLKSLSAGISRTVNDDDLRLMIENIERFARKQRDKRICMVIIFIILMICVIVMFLQKLM